jgi:hypothetical protein
VRIVRDKKGRSRGYAFIVYEREQDVERGRTVRGRKPCLSAAVSRGQDVALAETGTASEDAVVVDLVTMGDIVGEETVSEEDGTICARIQ